VNGNCIFRVRKIALCRARPDTQGALHHVIFRGIDRADLFADDVDRKKFPERLGEVVGNTSSTVYAFAFTS
jgi:putative transposase